MQNLLIELKRFVNLTEDNKIEIKNKEEMEINGDLVEHLKKCLNDFKKINFDFDSNKYLVLKLFIFFL